MPAATSSSARRRRTRTASRGSSTASRSSSTSRPRRSTASSRRRAEAGGPLPSAPLILASASPRRRELLERVGLALEVRPADVDETPLPGEAPRAYVARVARAKAQALARPGAWVLAADTTVTIDGAILGKAADGAEAAAMLRRLSGRVHEVITAFTLLGDAARDEVVASEVELVALDEPTIAAYVASGEWRGKAGAYAIQGIGAAR